MAYGEIPCHCGDTMKKKTYLPECMQEHIYTNNVVLGKQRQRGKLAVIVELVNSISTKTEQKKENFTK